MRWIIICILFFTVSEGFAQYSEWVATDRPCQTMNPASIGKKVIQMQTGYTNGRIGGESKSNYNIFDTKVRFGVLERGDISFGAIAGWYGVQGDVESRQERIDLYTINARYNIFQGEGAAPSVGAEVGVGFPVEDYELLDDLNFRAVLSLSSAVSDDFAITANIITNRPENLEFTLNFAYAFTERIGALAEYWAIFDGGMGDSRSGYANFGAYYNLSKNFQVDLAVFNMVDKGDREESNFTDLQFQVGFSGRLDWRD